MVYRPDPERMRGRARELITARNWGIGLITTLLGVGMLLSEIQRIRAAEPDLMNCAYLLLFAVSGLLIFFWIWATQREFDLLIEYLDPEHYNPPSTVKETLLILLFAVLLIGLLFAARNPFGFGLVFSAYSVLLIPSTRYMTSELRQAIQKSRERLTRDLQDPQLKRKAILYGSAVDVLESYFFKRPMTARLLVIASFSLFGLALASAWRIWGTRLLGLGAYLVFILTVVISEAVINYWRVVRDNALRPIAAELEEIERAEQEAGRTRERTVR